MKKKHIFEVISIYDIPLPTAYNKWVSGSGFQPSLKSPSATSDTHKTLGEITAVKLRRMGT